MKDLYTLEGDSLQEFLRELAPPHDDIRKVTFCVEDGLQVKVNEDVWTVPLTEPADATTTPRANALGPQDTEVALGALLSLWRGDVLDSGQRAVVDRFVLWADAQ